MEERGEKIVKLKLLKTKLEFPSSNSSSTNEFLEISKVNRYLEALKLDIKEKVIHLSTLRFALIEASRFRSKIDDKKFENKVKMIQNLVLLLKKDLTNR